MNETLFKNIIGQFDFELQSILTEATVKSDPTLSDCFDLQTKLETLIKQRGDSVEYTKTQLGMK